MWECMKRAIFPGYRVQCTVIVRCRLAVHHRSFQLAYELLSWDANLNPNPDDMQQADILPLLSKFSHKQEDF